LRVGTVSIIGLPNAGKSTLLNALAGMKLAIVSSKPQTTRTSVQGVLTEPELGQIVFVDTPGIHKSDSIFNQRMMRTVRGSLANLDAVVYVVDARREIDEEQRQAMDVLQNVDVPVILALNKIDKINKKEKLIALLAEYQKVREFAAYIPISAAHGDQVDVLKNEIFKHLPEGEPIFPEDHVTDQPSRFIAAEMIREKLLEQTEQEVPHSVAVFVEKWEETPKIIRVTATVFVEKEGQKAIVIGQGGAMIKKIGTEARLELEKFFEQKFYLELFVKVRPNWRENIEFLNELDWRKMIGGDSSSEK
jgi:GTPase